MYRNQWLPYVACYCSGSLHHVVLLSFLMMVQQSANRKMSTNVLLGNANGVPTVCRLCAGCVQAFASQNNEAKQLTVGPSARE